MTDYQVVRSRRRTVALQVDQTGSVVVRAPMTLPAEEIRTFVETLYQVISASQADDLITFTADWKKSMNAVVTALKEVDDQTAIQK